MHTTFARSFPVLAFLAAACGGVNLGSNADAGGPGGGCGSRGLPSCALPPGTAGSACGTRGQPPCAMGLTCLFSRAANCGALDEPGTCTDFRAVDCIPTGPTVCGCDGNTYGSECEAHLLSTSVRHDGACP